MKLWLAMTAYNRPKYLRPVLESIADNVDLLDWQGLFVALEPANLEVRKQIEQIRFLPTRIRYNPKIEGPFRNPYLAIEGAFEQGADFVLYNQDDTVLSPDALRLAAWFANLPDRDRFLGLNLWAYRSDPERPLEVFAHCGEGAAVTRRAGLDKVFPGLTFGFSKENWKRYGAPVWTANSQGNAGPDWALSGYYDGSFDIQLQSLAPAFARCRTIGRIGVFCSPGLHDYVFAKVPYNRKVREGQYRLMEETVQS